MAIYRGSLRIEGDDAPPVDCVITVGDGRLSIVSAGQEIGHWSLDQVGLSRTSEGFRLEVEGERLLLVTYQADAFAVDAGVAASGSSHGQGES